MARTDCFNLISGLVFITPFVCLLLVLQWGGTAYPWTKGRIVALFVFSSVVLNLVSGMLVKVPSYHTPFVVLGTVLKAIEAVIMSLWNPNTTVLVWVVCQILFGTGCASRHCAHHFSPASGQRPVSLDRQQRLLEPASQGLGRVRIRSRFGNGAAVGSASFRIAMPAGALSIVI
ncbi:MFS multidrug transporter [Apiospora arundinis]